MGKFEAVAERNSQLGFRGLGCRGSGLGFRAWTIQHCSKLRTLSPKTVNPTSNTLTLNPKPKIEFQP